MSEMKQTPGPTKTTEEIVRLWNEGEAGQAVGALCDRLEVLEGKQADDMQAIAYLGGMTEDRAPEWEHTCLSSDGGFIRGKMLPRSVEKCGRCGASKEAAPPEDDPWREGAICIVFDGPPSHESGRFVEVETPSGKGVTIGKWEENETAGFWSLTIQAPATTQPADPKTPFCDQCPAPEHEHRLVSSASGMSVTCPESADPGPTAETEKARADGTCVRCGEPYGPSGSCSRRREGCQGGRGEATAPFSEKALKRIRQRAMSPADLPEDPPAFDAWAIREKDERFSAWLELVMGLVCSIGAEEGERQSLERSFKRDLDADPALREALRRLGESVGAVSAIDEIAKFLEQIVPGPGDVAFAVKSEVRRLRKECEMWLSKMHEERKEKEDLKTEVARLTEELGDAQHEQREQALNLAAERKRSVEAEAKVTEYGVGFDKARAHYEDTIREQAQEIENVMADRARWKSVAYDKQAELDAELAAQKEARCELTDCRLRYPALAPPAEEPCHCDDCPDCENRAAAEASHDEPAAKEPLVIEKLARAIREAGRRVPLGGSLSVRGDVPISGMNLAEHCAKIVEDWGSDRDLLARFYDGDPAEERIGTIDENDPDYWTCHCKSKRARRHSMKLTLACRPCNTRRPTTEDETHE